MIRGEKKKEKTSGLLATRWRPCRQSGSSALRSAFVV